VIKYGRVIYKRGYGIADLGRGVPIAPSTVFHAASLAKQFTAMCILLLVQRGRLSLDDDVRQHLSPDLLGNLDVSAGVQITIRDILGHVSGIRDQWTLVTLSDWRLPDDVVTLGDVLELVRQMRSLDFNPGYDWNYSNTGYTLAGEIVETASGSSLAEFAQRNIFNPLGMKHTRFSESHDLVVHHRAYGYQKVESGSFQLMMPNYDLTGPTNLLTTVEDLARWDRNFEDKTVGGEFALSQMRTPGTLSNGQSTGYGLGLFLWTYRGLNTVEHNGRDAGYRSHLIRFPNQHFAVACLCNLALPGDADLRCLALRVADIYLADQLGPVTPSDTPPQTVQELQPRPGIFQNTSTGSRALISATPHGLKLSVGHNTGSLMTLNRNRYRWLNPTRAGEVEFSVSGDSGQTQLSLQSDGEESLLFDALGPIEVTPDTLNEYMGKYYSDELDTYYSVGLEGSSLAIRRHKYPPVMLQSVSLDVFFTGKFSVMVTAGVMVFNRDPDYKITGFALTSIEGAYIKCLRFTKLW
jgi:CubicO group peptidase (beta-lactamase class C family)